MVKKRPGPMAYCLGGFLLLVIIAPFFQVILASFLDEGQVTLKPYYRVFLGSPAYLLSFWHTLALCTFVVAGQTILSLFSGLAFAKLPFPGREVYFFLLIIVMVLPVQVTLVPNYRILENLSLLNTQWAVIFPAVFAPLGTFLMTQAFRSIPQEVLEAAQLDGANLVEILWKICTPMSKSGTATVMLLSFLGAWNMVEQPLAYLQEVKKYPLPVSLAYIRNDDLSVQLVCCLLTWIPPVLLFLRFRSHLVEGIALVEKGGPL